MGFRAGDSDQTQPFNAAVLFENFVSQPHQRPFDLRTRHQLRFLCERRLANRMLLNGHCQAYLGRMTWNARNALHRIDPSSRMYWSRYGTSRIHDARQWLNLRNRLVEPARIALPWKAAGGRDNFGNGNKYITPAIASRKVYVGTTTGVGVFGLLK